MPVNNRFHRRVARVVSGNEARVALTTACATGTSTPTASSGSANRNGLHTALRTVMPASIAVMRCHSGIWATEPSSPDAGSYSD